MYVFARMHNTSIHVLLCVLLSVQPVGSSWDLETSYSTVFLLGKLLMTVRVTGSSYPPALLPFS